MRKLQIDFVLNYWDGPVEFFGTLDNQFIYALLVSDYVHDEPRTFEYWLVNMGTRTLAQRLSAPASGRFDSDKVDIDL